MTAAGRKIFGGVAFCLALAACSEEAVVGEPEVSGDFSVIAIRRASDVAGGPVDPAAEGLLDRTVQFGEHLVWLDGTECSDWSLREAEAPAVSVGDPLLSDTQIGPLDGPMSTGDKRQNKSFELLCGGNVLTAFLKVDGRILVWPTPSGLSNVVLERPLAPGQVEAFQRELKSMKFFGGVPAATWNETSLRAISFYAQYRGAAYTFNRAAIGENLLDGLGVLDGAHEARVEDAAPAAPISPPAEEAEAPTAEPAPSISDRFPDYQPKLSEDTLLDYRPGLLPALVAVPDASLDNLGTLLSLLDQATMDAHTSPGQWEAGNVAIGADPLEYVPSDEELIAAEIGDRIAQIMESADPLTFTGVWETLKRGDQSVQYLGFDFRHVDVMGSGRFFYASEPKHRLVQIPGTPAQEAAD